MLQITLGIEGMMCGMCEAHMNDVVRKLYPDVKKVSSSHSRNQTVVLSESELDEARLREGISAIGYRLTSFRSEPYVRKTLWQKLFG